MEAHTRVSVENLPMDFVDSEQEDERSHNVNLRRARTDVQMSPRHEYGITKRHSYNGGDYTMPARAGGEFLGYAQHHGTSRRPSAWFNTVMARRRRGETPHTEQEAVDEIAEAMESDSKFMTDDVDGEIMRRDTVRELTKPLRVKKEIRRRLTARRSSSRAASRNISGFRHMQYTMSMYWYKAKQSVHDTFHDYSLWHKDLKEIEGTFGTSVGSYFRFLRYLFILNLFIAITSCGFLLTPQLLSSSTTESGQFGAWDWLTGAGWFNKTELYYGAYTNGTVSLGQEYDMTQAYYFTTMAIFLVNLIVILRRVIVLYKNNYIDAEHDVTSTFVNKVFAAWDFTITEDKAANIKHKSVYNELTEMLQELHGDDAVEGGCARVMGWTVKLVFWVVVLGFLGLVGWLMWLMQHEVTQVLIYPLTVTLIMLIVPVVFEGLVNIEGYKIPRHRLYVTLVRTIMLALTILGVLVAYWFTLDNTENESSTASPTTTPVENETDIESCWESSLGQEFYRLLIIDFLVFLVMNLGIILIFVITRKKDFGRMLANVLEFNVARNTLHLIYNQTLLWAGLFFCPLTPLIVVLKMIVTFYIQKFIVLKFLRADERPWRAAQSETVFFALTLVSFMLSFIGFIFISVRGQPSSSCGPFREDDDYVQFIRQLLQAENKQLVLTVIEWILKPGVVAAILGILILLVYCAKSMAEGRAEMIKVLRKQLELEMLDRTYLLQLTEKVRNGEYKPTPGGQLKYAPPQHPGRSAHSLTQRGSFVFTDSKAYSREDGRFFTDSTEFEVEVDGMPPVSS